MIADASFGPPAAGVRPLRFTPRASIPPATACLVANGLRETLRDLLGTRCELVLGEPAAIAADAWSALAHDAFLFLTRGRQTDIVLVLPRRDARRLVLRAFGEGDALPDEACSALELHAIERIAARCAATFDPLCAERTAASRAVAVHEIPRCVAYFDVRVQVPVCLEIGIGIVRDLPDAGAAGRVPLSALGEVTLRADAVFGNGTVSYAQAMALRPGLLLPLNVPLDAPARLRIAGRTLAYGACGARDGRTALRIAALAGAQA
jgi:hypothetical protein